MAQKTDLPVPLSVTTGAWVNVEGQLNKYLRIYGAAFTATLQLEGSVQDDKSDAFSIGAAVTNANAWVSVPDTVIWLRINTTSYGSGTPKARITSTSPI